MAMSGASLLGDSLRWSQAWPRVEARNPQAKGLRIWGPPLYGNVRYVGESFAHFLGGILVVLELAVELRHVPRGYLLPDDSASLATPVG